MDMELSRAYPETWKAMAELVNKGKTRYIGKSHSTASGTKGFR